MKLPTTNMMITIIIGLFLACCSGVWAQLMTCPQVCSCIWRNGKQTTICENQNLISIPNQISPSTQVLDLNNNNFQILPSKAFQERGLINLQKLFLPHCKLGAIADDAFHQLTNLVELDLSDNLLTHVPVKALANATNLRRLLLNNNHITTITAESFAALGNLKFLNLSGCKTHTIEPRAFYGLRDLEYLYLHNNQLTTLPYAVVVDLPALYSFELYKNPWQCNCEMRPTREWMIRNNVGQSIPPTCDLPIRLSGLMWNSLDLDDFACEPDIITTNVEVAKVAGSNATLSCVVKGLPEPKVFWYMDHGYYNISSNHHPQRSQKYHLSEERTEGMVNSMLTIVGLDPADDGMSFICSAENRAGIKSKNFTVYVVPSGAFSGVTANWSKVELAGGLLALLILLVLVFVVITLILIRSKRFPLYGGAGASDPDHLKTGQHSDSLEKKKPPSLGKMFGGNGGGGGASVYPNGGNTNTNLAYGMQQLSMLGLDGIDKKPEIFLKTSTNNNAHNNNNNHTHNHQQPDLVGHQVQTTQTQQQQQHQLYAQSNGLNLITGYELNHFNNNNGQAFVNDLLGNNGQQQQDTLFFDDGGQFGYPTTTQQQQQQANLQDNSGLFRAVMVPPSVITNSSGLISAPQTNSSTMTVGTRSSPPTYMLSATNLYNQYLSQYDLNNVQQTTTQQPNYHPSQQQHQQQQQYFQQQFAVASSNPNSSPSPLVYGNPGFVSDSFLHPSMVQYNNEDISGDDDDVFRSSMPTMMDQLILPQHFSNIGRQATVNTPSPPLPRQSTGVNLMNGESIYGVRRTPMTTPNPFSAVPMHMAPPTPIQHQQQQLQQQQAIYGVTGMLKNRWQSGTLTPSSVHQQQQPQQLQQQQSQQSIHFQAQPQRNLLANSGSNTVANMMNTSLSNIRCSPDEGYGEESSNGPSVGQLEGTEV